MAKKTYLDFSLFDEVGDAMDLFGNLIRNSFEYDAFAGKDEFPAIVLTPPVPMDVSQIDAFLPKSDDDDDDSEDKIPKFTFKARIIGPNSPHQFLPDPCNQQVLKDLKQQQNAQDIFDMHTTVIAIGATEKPSLGDVVTIKLEGGSFSYNLQTATFVRLVSSEDQTIKNLLGSQKNECKVGLNSLFAGGFVGSTAASTEGKPGSFDSPPFTKCAASKYQQLEQRERKWTNPTPQEREAAVRSVAQDSQLAATMLTIMSMEQPVDVGMPDYNPAGIQGDNRKWNEQVNNVVAYQTCIRDNEEYRIFLAFNTLEDGITAFAEALKPKNIPSSTGDINTDAYNLTKWYYQRWNLAATDEEIDKLEKTGTFVRSGTEYKRNFKTTQATFKKGLKKFTPKK